MKHFHAFLSPKKHNKKLLRLILQTKSVFFLFLISMIAGGLVANTLLETTFRSSFADFKTNTDMILLLNTKTHPLLFYYLFLHAKTFFLLIFFSYTNVWKLYSRIFLCYNGILQGILYTFCLHHGTVFPGTLEYLCFLFPHGLIFIPLYLFCFINFQKTNEKLFLLSGKAQKRELFFKQLPIYAVSILCLLLGSILEAYVNLPLLQHFLSHLG